MKSVDLGTLNLQADPYRIVGTNAFDAPNRQVNLINLARDDGARAVFERYNPKPITLDGYINASSSDNAESALDDLKQRLGVSGQNLDIGWRGGIRRWVVQMTDCIIARDATDVSRMGFSAKFIAPNPISVDTTSVTAVDETGVTDLSDTYSFNNSGTYFALPVITLTINSIDPDDSDVTLTIGDANTSRYLDITGTFVADDVIVIDCVNKTVKLNGDLIGASGLFPLWLAGNGNLEYSTTDVSTINIDIEAVYDRRWL